MQAKFCTKCGNALKENDKFCRKCGAPVKVFNAGTAPQANVQPQRQAAPQQFQPQRQTQVQPQRRTPAPMPRAGAYAANENPEGTVMLGDLNRIQRGGKTTKKGTIGLSIEEMLRGCSKVVDFGTGKRYEIVIPAGLTPGDVIVVENTGIVDRETGGICDIELTTEIE